MVVALMRVIMHSGIKLMNPKAVKISAILLSLASVFVASSGWCATRLSGDAQLSYTKYDASLDGKDVFNGSSLVQKYSLAYNTSNITYRHQPNYYKLMVGYELFDFKTKINDPTQETTIKQDFGRAKYSGEVAYNETVLPIRFRAYINDNQPLGLKTGLNTFGIISDDLAYDIDGRGKSTSSGVSVEFEPEVSNNISIRALPRVLFDYREAFNKSSEDVNYRVDTKTRELAVAGLNKENNWVHYRFLNFENFLVPTDNFKQQQIQIGLVDPHGMRKWSSLTNWIEVSSDAQLTNILSPSKERNLEEYDINFMAIAKRQKWDARTFMNYNRQMTDDKLTEVARVPVFVRGIYGAETDWYVSLSASRGRENQFPALGADTSYSNTISLGGTTFNRSKFTLSPSMSLQSTKAFRGEDAYSMVSSLETVSTSRFSDTLGLGAKIYTRAQDDGSGSSTSKTWSGNLDLRASYRPNSKFVYKIVDQIESGNGGGYMSASRLQTATGSISLGNYLHNNFLVSAGWTPNARFATSIEGTYDLIKAPGLPDNTEASVAYRASYDIANINYRVDSKYIQRNNGFDGTGSSWRSTAQTQYRPDKYIDALLRFLHESEKSSSIEITKIQLLQRYKYSFFSRTGEMRNVASLTEEYSFSKSDSSSLTSDNVQYLMLSGRYSPTDRYSLYGSARYEESIPSGAMTLFYSAGVSADFKLLSTSIDYTHAKRDVDNRIEKKLAASVKRSF